MLNVKKTLTKLINCSVFTVEAVGVTYGNIASGGTSNQTVDVTKDGYIPIGVVGYNNTGSTGFYPYQMTIDLINGRYILSAYARAVSAVSNGGLSVRVLYRKLGGVIRTLKNAIANLYREGVAVC